MGLVAKNSTRTYTIEEYLLLEEKSSIKHYFINGNIIEMPGATYQHNLIATNITTALNIALENKSEAYFVLNSDMKIFIPRTLSFVYPDAIVICEAPVYYNQRKDVLLNPLLIVEVLSPATEEFDRGSKFYDYKQIATFQEYVLVEQNSAHITSSYKIAERTWLDTEAEGLEASIYLKSIDCNIKLSKLYKGVQLIS